MIELFYYLHESLVLLPGFFELGIVNTNMDIHHSQKKAVLFSKDSLFVY